MFSEAGPGGQSVNTTDSAVRITHIPSGIVVSQQDEKSQIRNKEKGLKILRSRIYELERKKLEDARSKDRKDKIGTGDRSERIRTYNFPQGRVTDHRINLTLHKLEEFMEGEVFDEIVESLSLYAQEQELRSMEMNLMEVLNKGYYTLKSSKIKSYKIDAELLLSDSLNICKEELILNLRRNIKTQDYKNFLCKLERRKVREPIAYILKKKEFWKNEFYVDKNVLIPRPETEHLIDETLKIIPLTKSFNLLEIGIGSGCIIISILKERKKCSATGIDCCKSY